MPKGTIGKYFFEVGDDASPTAFTRLCSVFSMPGIGKQKTLEDVTTFCSGNNREFIPGLADGKEFTVTANYPGDEDEAIEELMAFVDGDDPGIFRVLKEHSTPHKYIIMTLVGMGYEEAPSVDSKNTVAFTFKISGDMERGTLAP